ncbi:hypothetical protein BpHYR1_050713 [Brachionus plicatilis]|uniref:Uncharacterized protein n=1 Tax=Brachionus plicatilis TaxID=10195 RepID=A0A3M7T2D2_BRAPC|nr:hypothetical protein BpHYR1_050713 [Brachionus plicatilis]
MTFSTQFSTLSVRNAKQIFQKHADSDPSYENEQQKLSRQKEFNSWRGHGTYTYTLRMCAEALAGQLAQIFMKSLTESTLPVEWKTANVSSTEAVKICLSKFCKRRLYVSFS